MESPARGGRTGQSFGSWKLLDRLKRAVELCAEADYQMKSSSADDAELLKELVTRIIAGEESA